MRHHRLLLAVDDERERLDRRAGRPARAAHEDGGPRADGELLGERRVELDVEDGRQSAHEGTLPRDAGPTSAAAGGRPDPCAALARRRRPRPPAARYDEWLELAAGDALRTIDAACADGRPEHLARFRALDADVWALLLTQEYEGWPNVRALLPSVPDPALQASWNGTSGAALAAQGVAFYRRLCERFAAHGPVPLEAARVLDFGCGWGRLTRMLARDVAPGNLFGCDPAQGILDVCRADRVPARARPQRLPAAAPPVRRPVRPRVRVLRVHPPVRAGGGGEPRRAPRRARPGRRPRADGPAAVVPGGRRTGFRFVPHAAEPSHPQWGGGEMTYGETVIPLAYVRECWSDRFELLDADILLGDLFQAVLTLRRS